jgi:hypothetical protein
VRVLKKLQATGSNYESTYYRYGQEITIEDRLLAGTCYEIWLQKRIIKHTERLVAQQPIELAGSNRVR